MLLAAIVGCGAPTTEPIDAEDTSITIEALRQQAEGRSGRASNAARTFAPEMIAAGDHLVKLAAEQSDEAKARAFIARADRYYRDAEQVAESIRGARTLTFPSDRSLGEVSVAPWNSSMWDERGPAQGAIKIPEESEVALKVTKGFNAADMDALVALGPGAIQYLTLGGATEASDVLSKVDDLIGLRDLSLAEFRNLDDAALTPLGDCHALRHLNLMTGINAITDETTERIARFPALEDLAIEGQGITDRSAYLIAQLPSLQNLFFRQTNITDLGVDYIAARRPLERLWLYGPAITPFSVPVLAEMDTLTELVLMQTSIQSAGVQQLRDALPRCNVDTTS